MSEDDINAFIISMKAFIFFLYIHLYDILFPGFRL